MADAAFNPDQYLAEKTQLAAATPVVAPPAEKEDRPGAIRQGISSFMKNHPNVAEVASDAGRVLDYPAGLVRTGLASYGGMLTGQAGKVNDTDVINALKGQAPSSAEYMKRLGVGTGPDVLNNSITGRITARDVGGFGLDVGTDPLTALGMAGKVATPVGDAVESAGKSAYKSGFKKIDEGLIEKGAKPLSDVLLENGAPTGTTKSIAGKVGEMSNEARTNRAALYQEAADKGVSVDLAHPLPKAEELIQGLLQDKRPSVQALGQELADHLQSEYKNNGKVDLGTLSDWKSDIYNGLPESAFRDGRPLPVAKKFNAALGSDFKDAIEQGGNVARPGMGDEIGAINKDWGSMLGSRKSMEAQIRRGNTTNAVTPIDAILATLHPGVEVAKKAADVSKTTWARTNAGKGLMNLGQSGLVDPVARQSVEGLINQQQTPFDPDMYLKEKSMRLTQ